MSAYKNRWASCTHGKRNSRVCVECWKAVQPKTVHTTRGLLTALTEFSELVSHVPTIASRLNEEGKRLLEEARNTIDPTPSFQPHFNVVRKTLAELRQPAIDRRDHEWQARVLIPMAVTPMSPQKYAEKWGWRS